MEHFWFQGEEVPFCICWDDKVEKVVERITTHFYYCFDELVACIMSVHFKVVGLSGWEGWDSIIFLFNYKLANASIDIEIKK